MKGIAIEFISHENPFRESNIFISGDSWKSVEEKLKSSLSKIHEKYNEHVSYFNWMNIDSDFAANHNHDAEISVYYTDNETKDERSCSYQINFNVVNIVL